jgi:hypothetical protein
MTPCSLKDRNQSFGGTCSQIYANSTSKMEAIGSLNTFVLIYQTILRHIREYRNLNILILIFIPSISESELLTQVSERNFLYVCIQQHFMKETKYSLPVV